MKNTLTKRTFKTPLAAISCALKSNFSFIETQNAGHYENGIYEKFKPSAVDIDLIQFKVKQPNYLGETMSDSKCWIWRITKVKNIFENLEIKVSVSNYLKNVEFDFANGENLDAFEINNDQWKLHLRTEDGEILNNRAENTDWFPTRLLNTKKHWQEIIDLNESSIQTNVPELKTGEKIHLQYLSAYQNYNTKIITTWLAVNENTSELEKWIGIK